MLVICAKMHGDIVKQFSSHVSCSPNLETREKLKPEIFKSKDALIVNPLPLIHYGTQHGVLALQGTLAVNQCHVLYYDLEICCIKH